VLPLKGTAAVSRPVASSIIELLDAGLTITQDWRRRNFLNTNQISTVSCRGKTTVRLHMAAPKKRFLNFDGYRKKTYLSKSKQIN